MLAKDLIFQCVLKYLFFDGHTESMMLPQIQYKGKTLVFMADLLPSTGHIPLPYVMGYDTRPLLTLTEKERFLKEAADNILSAFADRPHIFNLGHGILPDTPIENVEMLLRLVRKG